MAGLLSSASNFLPFIICIFRSRLDAFTVLQDSLGHLPTTQWVGCLGYLLDASSTADGVSQLLQRTGLLGYWWLFCCRSCCRSVCDGGTVLRSHGFYSSCVRSSGAPTLGCSASREACDAPGARAFWIPPVSALWRAAFEFSAACIPSVMRLKCLRPSEVSAYIESRDAGFSSSESSSW